MALFETDYSNKAFIITIAGFAADSAEAGLFVNKLKEEIRDIDVKDYTLVANGEDMSTFKPEILPVLEQSYKLYMSLGFKKVLVVSPKKVTPRLQVKRIAKNVQFTGMFVSSKQEALAISAEIL